MARVTVEDCLKNVKNRFELVIVAAKRARQLMRGKEPKVDWDNDKPTVVALREIAAGFTNASNVHSTESHEEPREILHVVKVEVEAEVEVEVEEVDEIDIEIDEQPEATPGNTAEQPTEQPKADEE